MKRTKTTTDKMVAGLAAIALSIGVALAQDDEEEEVIPTTVDELLEAINDTLEEHDVPAVGLALVDETGPVWVGSLGKADLESDRNADADTIYRIGSTG